MKDRTGQSESPNDREQPQKVPKTNNEKLPENSKERLDRALDEGVEETFPASDPVSVKITK
jgi:hypothetical protein